jgi:F-type H+-transporting ATPase subunit b
VVELNFTFVYFAVSFLAFVLLMKIFFFDRVASVINKRDEIIKQNLDSSQLTSKQMEEQLATASSSSILKTARDEALSIINLANNEAGSQRNRILDQAKVELSENYQNSIKQMELEKNQVLAEMDNMVNEISKVMTDKLIEELSSGKKVIGV